MNASTTEVFLSACEDGSVLDVLPQRLRPPAGLEAGEALLEFVDEVRRAIREIRPDRAAILMPESNSSGSYNQHLGRAVLETLARVAAAEEGLPLEVLTRAKVRSRLKLPRTGSLQEHVGQAGTPVGKYWNAGRGLAALTALAATSS